MTYFIFAAVLFIVFLTGIKVVKKFRKHYQPNRWLVALLGPFLLITPLILTPNLPASIWLVLAMLFIWTNIYFFETTRFLLESGKIKTGFKRQTNE